MRYFRPSLRASRILDNGRQPLRGRAAKIALVAFSMMLVLRSVLFCKMNASGRQMIAFWLHRKGENWTLQSVDKQSSAEDISSCMQKSSLYHYITKGGKYKSAAIIQLNKEIGSDLSKVLLIFQAKGKKIVHLETRKMPSGRFQLYLEIESKSSEDWNSVRSIVETLNGIDIQPKEEMSDGSFNEAAEDKSPTSDEADGLDNMPWFPKKITDLDNFQRVLHYGSDLDADHPGFKDPKYRKRRRMFAEIAMCYKQGQPIPRIKYTPEEVETWGKVYNNLKKIHDLYACSEFKQNWGELEKEAGYRADNIPQLEDINIYLKKKTGFQIRPVAGYLSPRDFLAGLAFRVFHCTQYIRHSSDPFYTPEPDCVHEILGHMPLLADPSFAQFSQEIGLASLGASDEDVKKLAACYFFTVEFGLCVENGELKIYGAGLLSSGAELEHVINGIRKGQICLQKFNVEDAYNTECVVTSYQKRYFYNESIDEAKQELRSLAASIKKPFEVRYNPYTQTVQTLTSSDKIMDIAKELKGDVYLIANAIRKIQENETESDVLDFQEICQLLDLQPAKGED